MKNNRILEVGILSISPSQVQTPKDCFSRKSRILFSVFSVYVAKITIKEVILLFLA